MCLNKKAYKVLRIPFASKKYISEEYGKENKNFYSFSGIAYYLFDENLFIVNNKAKIIAINSFRNEENEENYGKSYCKRNKDNALFNERNSIIKNTQTTNEQKVIKLNKLIQEKHLTVKDSYSLITGSNAKGACVGSSFASDEILAYSADDNQYNGWRFSTLFASGQEKRILEKTNKELLYKYTKTKNNSKKINPSFGKMDEYEEISIDDLMLVPELDRLFKVYNQDLLEEQSLTPYLEEINELKNPDNTKGVNLYPKITELRTIVAGLIQKLEKISHNEEGIKYFNRLIASFRREFRDNLLKTYIESGIYKEEILNKHKLDQVCEAAHIYDVKLIKQDINEILKKKSDDAIENISLLLGDISNHENGIFMDPTTHKYFDSKDNLIEIGSNGNLINHTDLSIYNNIEIELTKNQKHYLEKRNHKR